MRDKVRVVEGRNVLGCIKRRGRGQGYYWARLAVGWRVVCVEGESLGSCGSHWMPTKRHALRYAAARGEEVI